MTRRTVVIAATLAATVLSAVNTRAQAPRPRLVAPVRGEATISHLAPNTKATTSQVVTTIQIKNTSALAIAGLKVEEFWYDSANNLLPGDSQTVRAPIQPGAIVTVTLTTPRTPQMTRNQYRFSHANGTIKATLAKTLEE